FKAIDWLFSLFLIAAVVGQVYCDVTIPEYTNKLMTALTDKTKTGWDVWMVGWPMIVYATGSMVGTIIAAYFASLIGAHFSQYLRAEMFRKVQGFGFDELNKFGTPSLITRSTNDIEQVQMAMMFILRMGVSAPLTAVWAIVKIQQASTPLMEATGIWMAFLIATLILMVLLFLPKFAKIQKYTDKINLVTRQNLTGLRVVKAYGADEYEQQKTSKVVGESAKLTAFVGRVGGMMFPLMFLVLNGLMLTIYWLGTSLINGSGLHIAIPMPEGKPGDPQIVYDGGLSLPTMIEFVNLAIQVLFSFIMLLMLFVMVPRAIVSARRINEVRHTECVIQDPKEPKAFVPSADIEFKNVSFKYVGADDYVLKNLNFKIEAGQTVAFIGSTGSGKSTLINLVPRFYDTTEGEILVGGVNVKDIKQEDLLKTIGYVPQKGMLFSGTVSDNIGFGLTDQETAKMQEKPKTQEVPEGEVVKPSEEYSEMERVAMVASAHGFVKDLNGEYQAHIAQGGKNVSGGQRQRLSIARAVAMDPKIFIFDDSFSALDYKTDKAVRAALKERGRGATNLIVAQRVGSIMDADKIIVLNEGEMVGQGTHKELMSVCDIYQEIALSQLSRKELGLAE
ncbi:MAG: ABC transporter ATP-binding protein/permease, partial [Firmicutes bacterium]|nr:ABC transporter ATP-binding protein/permease [Bacillota bacterium]